ncbi:hypothetical protein FOFC_15983 [Fusarium oxysporum]|nr:hypothetical protein FOFC_15983 [Fusarium oxysporum]
MARDSSKQQWKFLNPHLCPSEPSVPSGFLPPPHWGVPTANSPAIPSQDMTQTALWLSPDNSTLPTDNFALGYPCHSSVPDPALNYCLLCGSSSSWHASCWFSDPLVYPTAYSPFDQSILETTPFASAQNAFCQLSPLSNPPSSTCFDGENVDLSFLLPDEQYIVEARLKGRKWAEIQVEYKDRWKDVTIPALLNKLKDLRDKHPTLEHILPSRQHQWSRASQMLWQRPTCCWYHG